MHRAFTVILVVLLVIALAIPAFATETQIHVPDGTTLPGMPELSGYTYFYVRKYNSNYIGYMMQQPLQKSLSDGYSPVANTSSYTYSYTNGEWKKGNSGYNYKSTDTLFPLNDIVWASHSIYYADGGLYLTGSIPRECDGSTCPANDVDHNNICDDCGNVLTYSLRSTLLDYAKTFAESYSSGYPYYAIVQHPTDSTAYNVFMSKIPMHAVVPNYDVAVGSGMQYSRVYTKDDGTYDRDTFVSVESFSGELVYANHTIENFREPPLAVVIQGVTGEAMEAEVPNLHLTMKTILLCGVGCLALLIGLKLFGKKSLIFLR